MKRVITLLIAFLNTTSLCAQINTDGSQIEFQTFLEVLKYADDHAVNIQNAKINEEIAKTANKESKSFLYPTVNAVAGYNNNLTIQPTLIPTDFFNPNAPSGTFEEFTFGKQHLYSTGIQAQWNILNFQKKFTWETADIVAQQSKVSIQKVKYSTYNLLASTYYSILLTQESIQIFEESLKISEAIYANTKTNFGKGIISEVELNLAETKKLENQKRLNQSKANLNLFYAQLQSQLNTNKEISVIDKPQNFVVNNNQLETEHPEISWQKLEVQKQQSILKQKKSLHLPTISFNYQYNYSWAVDEFMNFSNTNRLPQQVFGVKLNAPIFSGFSNRQKIKQSQWQVKQQKMLLDNTILVKQKEDEMMLLDLSKYAQELADNKEIMGLRQKNDAHAENKYQNGLINLNNRLDAFEDVLSAQNNYLQSLASYTLAQYKVYIRQIDFKNY
jgi:outer membrane protein TolC